MRSQSPIKTPAGLAPELILVTVYRYPDTGAAFFVVVQTPMELSGQPHWFIMGLLCFFPYAIREKQLAIDVLVKVQ